MCCRRGARAWIHVAPTPILRSWHMCAQMTGRCSARNPQSKAALVVCAPVKVSIANVARSTRSSMRPTHLASSGNKMARSWLVMAASPNLETMLMSRRGGGGGGGGFEAGCRDRIIDGARDAASSATGFADLYSRSTYCPGGAATRPPSVFAGDVGQLGHLGGPVPFKNFMKNPEIIRQYFKIMKTRETGDTDCVPARRFEKSPRCSTWRYLLACAPLLSHVPHTRSMKSVWLPHSDVTATDLTAGPDRYNLLCTL